MLSESHLFVSRNREQGLIAGFLFAHVENENEAHIGYVLGEHYWGQGLATELLTGFVDYSIKHKTWVKLVAGVEPSNIASSCLLTKLGFTQQPPMNDQVVFYEYRLSRHDSFPA